MQETAILKHFERLGVIMHGHFVYTSGKHGPVYLNKDALYPDTETTSRLCQAIARRFIESKVQAVVGPALGGIILSQWTAYHLTHMNGKAIPGVYAEKSVGGFILTRGYDKWIADRRVLIVEDILNTGGSVRKVVDAVRDAGGNVIGVGALCNRGKVTAHDVGDVPQLEALVNITLEVHDPDKCPLCADGVPINTDVGKGREFLAEQQA